MKKLLIATDCFLPRIDGIARFLADIIPHLNQTYQITVICPKFGEAPQFKDVTIIQMPLNPYIKFGDYQPAIANKKLIKQQVMEADIIWTHTLAPIGLTTIKLAQKYQKPYVPYVHSIDWQLIYRSVSKHNPLRMFFRAITKHIALSAFAKASAIMVPSKEVKEMMAWNITRAKCVIVPLGIDTEKFVPPLNKSDAKRALGFNAEDMILGYVGRISREKDLLTLLSAFESVHAKFPNAKLVIVGDGIESIKSQLANKPNVFLMGAQSNVVPYVQAFDIYAHPSLLETTCLACLEAMSCGLPCVVTPVGLMKEYIVHNKNGYTFPLHNNLVLSLKIEALIEDDALRGEIGNNARQTVINEYSWVRTISKVRNILQTLEGPK